MFGKIKTWTSTENYSKHLESLRKAIDKAEGVIIGAGAGLSTAAGLTYSGERFANNFAPFIDRYHFSDMYTATFYPYETLGEYWAYMSRHIYINRYEPDAGKPYKDLLEIIKHKKYFVITTNVDHQFQKAGVDKDRLFYTQGDYGLWQCAAPCHDYTYDNEAAVMKMIAQQHDLKVPAGLIPRCPKCGGPMSMNLRCDHTFVQDRGWREAAKRYKDFIKLYQNEGILYLELGVGNNTPSIIKYPFWEMASANKNAVYGCINLDDPVIPQKIESQSIGITGDIATVLGDLVK